MEQDKDAEVGHFSYFTSKLVAKVQIASCLKLQKMSENPSHQSFPGLAEISRKDRTGDQDRETANNALSNSRSL